MWNGFLSAKSGSAIILALVLAMAWPWSSATASAVILDPIVTFEDGRRQATVRVHNSGTMPLTCRMSLVNLRLLPGGGFEEVVEPAAEDRFADRFIRMSPRQVTIMPGGYQTLRISLRLPADLSPGDYRSYLRIEEMPQPVDPNAAQLAIGISLTHHLPVTIRHR